MRRRMGRPVGTGGNYTPRGLLNEAAKKELNRKRAKEGMRRLRAIRGW